MTAVTKYALISEAVYQRNGPEGNIPNLGLDIEDFGNAEYLEVNLPDPTDGFYAEAWRVDGKVVVAFRGTDFNGNRWADFISGNVPLAAGSIAASQFRQAIAFVEAVADQYSGGDRSSLVFTGHSLGGGLAGLMSVKYGAEAHVFAPAPFMNTANSPLFFPEGLSSEQKATLIAGPPGPEAPDYDTAKAKYDAAYEASQAIIQANLPKVTSYATEGDVLQWVGGGTTFGGVDRMFQIGGGSGVAESLAKHSMSLYVLLTQTDNGTNPNTDWSAREFAKLLRDDAILRASFLTQQAISGPVNRPVDENTATDPDAGMALRALASDLALYKAFHARFGTWLSSGAVAEGKSATDESSLSIHAAMVKLGLQVLRDNLNRSGTGRVMSESDFDKMFGAGNDDGPTKGYVRINRDDITAPDGEKQKEKLSGGVTQEFGVRDLNHRFVAGLEADFLPGLDGRGGPVDLAKFEATVGASTSEIIRGFKALPLWKIAIVQAGSGAMTYDASGTGDGAKSHVIIGHNGSDTITGGSERDYILAGAGADKIKGEGGNDVVSGGDGNDEIEGSDGDDLLIGGEGNDKIEGGAGDDWLVGNAGNDIFVGGVGKDLYYGGDGRDTLDFSEKADGALYVRGAAPKDGFFTFTVNGNENQTHSVEAIKLTDFADTLVVDRAMLDKRVTIDMARATVGNPDGRDTADFSQLNDGIIYSNGQVTTKGGGPAKLEISGADRLVFGSGNDTIKSARADTLIDTGAGSDAVWLADGIGIEGLSMDDRISLFGAVNLYGGARWKFSESPWATGLGGLVQYAFNAEGELVIRFVPTGWTTYVLNWREGAQLQGTTGQIEYGPGAITLFEYDGKVQRASDPVPDGYSWFTTWEVMFGLVKAASGVSLWRGLDPLVLDLDGDGIELTARSIATKFDGNFDLYAERTGWISPDDGMLARDIDGDGKITDGRELFGGREAGFTVLGRLDGNGDGLVSAADDGLADFNGDGVVDARDVYASLKIWRDLDRDGTTDPGELTGILDAGIVSIGVTGTTSNARVEGNTIRSTGSFTRADGSTGTVGDVVFSVDNSFTTYQGPPIAISDEARALPDLAARGALVTLRQALSARPEGIAAVDAALATLTNPDLAALKAAIRPILYAWMDGSPIRLADGRIVTGAEGRPPYNDMPFLADTNEDAVDYAWSVKHRTAGSGTGAVVETTWQFASGVIVKVERGETLAAVAIEDLQTGTFIRQGPTQKELRDGVWTDVDIFLDTDGRRLEISRPEGSLAVVLNALLPDHAGTSPLHWSALLGPDLAFFSRYVGEAFPVDVKPATLAAGLALVNALIDRFDAGLDLLAVKLAVQGGPLSGYFSSLVYSAASDMFGAISPERQLSSAYAALITEASTKPEPMEWLSGFADFLKIVVGAYSRGDGGLLVSNGFLVQNVVAGLDIAGSSLPIADVVQALGQSTDTLRVDSGDGTVTGTNSDGATGGTDILVAGATTTLMIGASGFDNYILGRDFGSVIVRDAEPAGQGAQEDDVLRFASHRSNEVTATREGLDLVISVIGTSQVVRIENQFDERLPSFSFVDQGIDWGVREIVFADGVVWTIQDIARAVSRVDAASTTVTGTNTVDWLNGGTGDDILVGGAESDIYWIGRGDGHDRIVDAETHGMRRDYDTVIFGPGIALADLRFGRVADGGDLTIYVGQDGQSITIEDEFWISPNVFADEGVSYIKGIEMFAFASGEGFSRDQVMNYLIDQSQTSGNDRIHGFARRDILEGGAGDDFVSGADGSDTYRFGFGDGHDVINETAKFLFLPLYDEVVFDSNVMASDATFSRNGDGDNLLITLSDGSTILIEEQFRRFEGGAFGKIWFNRIESFKFGDLDLTYTQVMARILASNITSGDDLTYGFEWENNFLASAGDDLLVGGSEGDNYHFGVGSGHDTIDERMRTIVTENDGIDRLYIAAGIMPDDVTVEDIDHKSYKITITATGDTLLLTDQFTYGTAFANFDEIEQVIFADGTIWTAEGVARMLLQQQISDGDDYVWGYGWSDDMDGGAGDDRLEGNAGGDKYYFGTGLGNDIINDNPGTAWGNDPDSLTFRGLSLDDLHFVDSMEELIVTIRSTGETLVIEKYFSSLPYWKIEWFNFADGTTLTSTDIDNLVTSQNALEGITKRGSRGSDNIYATPGDDGLFGDTGDDRLYGQDGSDRYIFRSGDGNDWILDYTGAPADIDVLVLRDLNPDDILLSRSGNVLRVTVKATGEIISVDDQFYAEGAAGRGIEQIQFSDGSAWDRAAIAETAWMRGTIAEDTFLGTANDDRFFGDLGADTFLSGAGSDIFIYRAGDGNDLIRENSGSTAEVDTLRLTDLHAGEIELIRSGNGLLIRALTTGETIEDSDHFYSTSANYGLDRIAFADGEIWDRDQMASRVILGGTDGNDILYGTDGDDQFRGDGGADIFHSWLGNDTFIYGAGDGNDVIRDGASSTAEVDTLRLTGLNASDIELTRSGNDLLIEILATGEIIEDDEHFYSTTAHYGLDRITFANGEIWDRARIASVAAFRGTAGDDAMIGTEGADIFVGGAGNDAIQSAGGSDTFIYRAGDGSDRIVETSTITGETDSLKLMDLVLADLTFSRSAADLFVKVNSTGHIIAVVDQFGAGAKGLEQIAFADGISWSRADIDSRVTTWADTLGGTPGPDTLNGTSSNDVISGYGGDDKLYGNSGADMLSGGTGNDFLQGDYGSDTYLFSLGDGQDRIRDNGSSSDVDELVLGAGISTGDVTVSQADAGQDLVLTIAGGDRIVLDDQLAGIWWGVDKVRFADGTVWDRAALLARATQPTAGDDTFYGDFAANTLSGGAGNDKLYGGSEADTLSGGSGNDTLQGDYGNDTYLFSLGDGQDRIRDNGSVSDVDELVLGPGISLGNVTVSQADGGLDLVLTIAGGDSIVLDDQSVVAGGGVDKVRFADGTVWDRAALLARATQPTSGDDTFYGDFAPNTLSGGAGNDKLYGGSDADTLSGGTGNDYLQGDYGNDTYLFNLGDGQDRIRDNGSGSDVDELVLGAGISIGDLVVSQADAGRDLVLATAGGDSIILDDQLAGAWGGVDKVRFADDTVWDRSALFQKSLTGGSGNDVIYGDGAANVISGGGGNDFLSGGGGSDTFVFDPNFDQDTIADFAAGAGSLDVIQFKQSIFADFAAVTVVREER